MKIVIEMANKNHGKVLVLPSPDSLPVDITGYDISVTYGYTERPGICGFAEKVPDGSQIFTLTLHPT